MRSQLSQADEWVNKKDSGMKNFTFFIPAAMKKKLDILAVNKEVPMKSLIVDAVAGDLSSLGEISSYPLPPKTKKISINNIPADLHSKLKTFAIERGVSMQDILIHLIQDILKK
jgi:hypothetical protein